MMMKINVKLYGVYKSLGQNEIELDVPENFQVSDIKKSILNSTQMTWSLISASVIAAGNDILNEDDKINHLRDFSILPPVSGG
jgi:hypothetical protein